MSASARVTPPSTNDDPLKADIGLVCALPLELAAFVSRWNRVKTYSGENFTFRGGYYNGIRIALVESGTGQKRATRATRALIDAHSPSWIVSTGFAGALTDSMHIGDRIVANQICLESGEALNIDIGMSSDPQQGLHVGGLLTVDRMVRTVEEKKNLNLQTQAVAVDMESFAVASVCRQTETRFIAVRTISDDLSVDLPKEALSLVGETGAVRLGALVGSLFKRPGCIKDLWRLREQSIEAADRLADFLGGVVKQLPTSRSQHASDS